MLTKEEANKIKVTDETEVAYINGEKIYAENLKKWAYRRLLTWPDLLAACKEYQLEIAVARKTGQPFDFAKVEGRINQAIAIAMQSV